MSKIPCPPDSAVTACHRTLDRDPESEALTLVVCNASLASEVTTNDVKRELSFKRRQRQARLKVAVLAPLLANTLNLWKACDAEALENPRTNN